ncbi:MAG TPA: hypothetical protein VMS77_02870 [Conexivisphaerales archaeon]|nr:hypothetical protein [Conexivisphaerales archaeon]
MAGDRFRVKCPYCRFDLSEIDSVRAIEEADYEVYTIECPWCGELIIIFGSEDPKFADSEKAGEIYERLHSEYWKRTWGSDG